MSTGQRATAVLLLVCAVCGAVGLTELRHALDYPEVLNAPPADTLAVVRERWLAIGVGVVLAGVAAGLLLPITVGIVRLLPRGPGRPLLTVLGAATAGAHLTGLLFWLITVPALARRAAIPAQADHASAVFDTARTLFGVMVGEVLACLLTATWSVALLTRAARAGASRRPPDRTGLPRAAAVGLAGWGGLAAVGVLCGVLLPFGMDAAITGRVIGELLWYLWLVGLAVAVWHLDPGALMADPTAAVPAALARSTDRVVGGPAQLRGAVPGPSPGSRRSWTAGIRRNTRPAPTAPTEDAHPANALPAALTNSALAADALVAGSIAVEAAAVDGARPREPGSSGDDFFDAATEISWERPPASDIAEPDRRPLRAAAQPAGRLLGDDAPTVPAVEIPVGGHSDRATRSEPADRRTAPDESAPESPG